jgi:ABC-type branched-subunit amino acid transport system permease subunit
LGRVLRALADSPTASQSLGVNPVSTKVLAFSIAAFLAAIAGGLLATLTQAISAASFDYSLSLLWVTVLVTGGATTLRGVVYAALLLIAAPYVLGNVVSSTAVAEWLPVTFGLTAIVMAQRPGGLATFTSIPDLVGAREIARGATRGRPVPADR